MPDDDSRCAPTVDAMMNLGVTRLRDERAHLRIVVFKAFGCCWERRAVCCGRSDAVTLKFTVLTNLTNA